MLIVPYRHPLLTARMAANLNDLSGGRLVLGVGVGLPRHDRADHRRPGAVAPAPCRHRGARPAQRRPARDGPPAAGLARPRGGRRSLDTLNRQFIPNGAVVTHEDQVAARPAGRDPGVLGVPWPAPADLPHLRRWGGLAAEGVDGGG